MSYVRGSRGEGGGGWMDIFWDFYTLYLAYNFGTSGCCESQANILSGAWNVNKLISLLLKDGYVIKTTDCSSGVKAFINMCLNQHIGPASSQYMEREENGKK